MQQAVSARTPAHLWIVGILATLWNCVGALDYVMTRMRNVDYLRSTMPSVDPNAFLAYIDGYPISAQIGWGLGVWGGLLGSILLLMRSRYSVWAFVLSLLGIVLSIVWSLTMGPTPPAGTEEGMGAVFPYIIIVVAVALLYYSWRQTKIGVLR